MIAFRRSVVAVPAGCVSLAGDDAGFVRVTVINVRS
jgi:hypothetical protein